MFEFESDLKSLFSTISLDGQDSKLVKVVDLAVMWVVKTYWVVSYF
jgi:hypothetical protein